jgi:hypothetical protein
MQRRRAGGPTARFRVPAGGWPLGRSLLRNLCACSLRVFSADGILLFLDRLRVAGHGPAPSVACFSTTLAHGLAWTVGRALASPPLAPNHRPPPPAHSQRTSRGSAAKSMTARSTRACTHRRVPGEIQCTRVGAALVTTVSALLLPAADPAPPLATSPRCTHDGAQARNQHLSGERRWGWQTPGQRPHTRTTHVHCALRREVHTGSGSPCSQQSHTSTQQQITRTGGRPGGGPGGGPMRSSGSRGTNTVDSSVPSTLLSTNRPLGDVSGVWATTPCPTTTRRPSASGGARVATTPTAAMQRAIHAHTATFSAVAFRRANGRAARAAVTTPRVDTEKLLSARSRHSRERLAWTDDGGARNGWGRMGSGDTTGVGTAAAAVANMRPGRLTGVKGMQTRYARQGGVAGTRGWGLRRLGAPPANPPGRWGPPSCAVCSERGGAWGGAQATAACSWPAQNAYHRRKALGDQHTREKSIRPVTAEFPRHGAAGPGRDTQTQGST